MNLLLIGTTEQTSEFMAGIWPALHEPIDLCDAADFRPRAQAGTLILRNADAMPVARQTALFAWLDAADGTGVVTTACTPLFPRVEAGLFLAALYYRLNTITIDLTAGAAVAMPDLSRRALAV